MYFDFSVSRKENKRCGCWEIHHLMRFPPSLVIVSWLGDTPAV